MSKKKKNRFTAATVSQHWAEHQQGIHLPHDVFQTTIDIWQQPAAAISVTLAHDFSELSISRWDR